MQLSQLILFVHDAPRMQAFYEQVLGLVVVDGDAAAGFVRLGDPAGGAILAVHATPAVGAPSDPPAAREDTAQKPCFHVDDIAAARASLVARGVTVREIHRFGGVAFCDALDPEGNIFQLTTRQGAQSAP
jgi:catechol 2,3-dioxygenase-like lactoylglutathione lyase family enzyme